MSILTICSHLIFQGRLLDAVNFELPQTLAKRQRAEPSPCCSLWQRWAGHKNTTRVDLTSMEESKNCIYRQSYQTPKAHKSWSQTSKSWNFRLLWLKMFCFTFNCRMSIKAVSSASRPKVTALLAHHCWCTDRLKADGGGYSRPYEKLMWG